jgi:hypothetical protein
MRSDYLSICAAAYTAGIMKNGAKFGARPSDVVAFIEGWVGGRSYLEVPQNLPNLTGGHAPYCGALLALLEMTCPPGFSTSMIRSLWVDLT